MISKIKFHLTASGLYTSLCLASLSLSTDVIILNSKPDFIYFTFLFFASFLYYNFHKISWYGHARMFETKNLKYLWPAQNPGYLFLALLLGFAGTAALITYSITNILQFIFGLLAFLIAIVYNQKILGKRLRAVKGMKAFAIALVAIITGVLIPSAKHIWQEKYLMFIILYALAQFCFVSAFCIAADFRDIIEDREDHTPTFPMIAGIEISKKLIMLLFIFQFSFLLILFNLAYLSLAQLETFMTVSLVSVFFIYQLHPKNSYYHFIFSIDGLIALQSIYIIFLRK